MTSGVKSLIRGAIRYVRGPTVSSADLRMILEALGRLGYDAGGLQRAVGITSSDLNDTDARFPCELHAAIVTRAQVERPLKNFALRVVEVTPIGANPLVDYLVVTSDTVGDGLTQLARYFRLVGPPVNIEVRERERPIRILFDCPFYEFGAEYTIALTMRNFRQETGGKFRAEHVNFAHALDDRSEYEHLFGCPVNVDQSWGGIVLSAEVWSVPMNRRDPVLRAVLERHSAEIAARTPSVSHGLEQELREVLSARVLGGDTRMEVVARHLGITPRTLQRRLAEAETSYQEMLDEARKVAAIEYISSSTLSISEIAYLLGYSDSAAFSRAFKRWTGMTPQVFRGQRDEPPAVSA